MRVRSGIKLGFAPDARVRHDQGGTTGSAGAIKNRKSLPIYMDERNKLHVVRDISGWRLPVAAATLLLLTCGMECVGRGANGVTPCRAGGRGSVMNAAYLRCWQVRLAL